MRSSSLYIIGFNIRSTKSPYTTDGIPANNSTAGRTIDAKRFGAVSAKNTAVNTPIGTPIRTAAAVPTIDVKITFKIPYSGTVPVGFQVDENKISTSPT